ncbi:MAG: stage II sporulation protein P [Clostridia bacterium]|nr:stage II sporulation protein P [Clostridia bacterium]
MKRLVYLIFSFLFILGCAEETVEVAPETTVSLNTFIIENATPTAAPTAEPSPTPIFSEPDDSGDIVINEGLLAELTPTTYAVPSDVVILIYHTHAEEAYRQEGDYTYEETEKNSYRTLDVEKNVVAVGVALKEALESYGFTVIHDTTDVEPPELLSAYSRSLKVMESYPEADIFIDLHRNAANVRFKSDDVVMLNDERCAKMFFVVGTGIGTYEGEYDVAPNWEANYRLALSITERLREIDPELALDIRTKVGRYNQHVSDMCLLLELGHNANTLDDVLNSVPYFAEAFADIIQLQTEVGE